MVRLTVKAPSGLIHLTGNDESTIHAAIKKLSDYEDMEEQSEITVLQQSSQGAADSGV